MVYKHLEQPSEKELRLLIMGEAGSGKTHCLKTLFNIYVYLKLIFAEKVASTGTAANNIDTVTAHSFFKIFCDSKLPNIKKFDIVRELIEKVKAIFCDEVFMLRISELLKMSESCQMSTDDELL